MKPGTAVCPILPMGESRLLYYHGFRRVGIQEKRQTPSFYGGGPVLRRKLSGSGKKLTQTPSRAMMKTITLTGSEKDGNGGGCVRNRWINSPAAYALGMFAMMVPTQAFSSFYFYFYVDELGLAVWLATIARTIYLVWDAVNQPLAGWLSDRTSTRLGRRRPWLLGAVPAYMLTFVMVFAVPPGLGKAGLFAWFLAALILIEAVATIIWVNYGALFPELFRGNRLRARASAVQQGFQIAALLVGTAATPLLYTSLGYGNMALIYAFLFGVLMLACIAGIREQEEARQGPRLSLQESFRTTLPTSRSGCTTSPTPSRRP